MNIKYLVLAAAFSFAGSSAWADSNLVSNGYFESDLSDWIVNGAEHQYGPNTDGVAQLNEVSQGLAGSISQVINIATSGIYKLTFDYRTYEPLAISLSTALDPHSWTYNAPNAGSVAFNGLALDVGSYVLSFSSLNARVDNVVLVPNVNSQVPVPGPEAGAGLGAIVMGGLALYLKRRRQTPAA